MAADCALMVCLWGNSVEPPTLARATDSHTIGHLFHIDVVGQVRLLAYVTAHGSGISVVSSFLACTPAVSAGVVSGSLVLPALICSLNTLSMSVSMAHRSLADGPS